MFLRKSQQHFSGSWILSKIQQLDLTNKIRTGKYDTRKLRSETKAGRKRKLEKYKKSQFESFF